MKQREDGQQRELGNDEKMKYATKQSGRSGGRRKEGKSEKRVRKERNPMQREWEGGKK